MNRIKVLASFVKKGAILLDVGTDHGYLIKELFRLDVISKAIASDINEGPLLNAKNNLSGLNVSYFLTDGLSGIDEYFDTCAIAGMGGILIKKIIEESFLKLKDKTIIVAPNKDSFLLRSYLCNNGFIIDKEELVLENNKFYEIIRFVPGVNKYSLLELHYGPLILTNLNLCSLLKLKKELKLLDLKRKYDKTYNELYLSLFNFLLKSGVYD